MRIEVYFHDSNLERKIDRILFKLETMMAKVDELLAELVEANNATNEIAADIADLVSKVGAGLSTAETASVQAELVALKDKLLAVAATHTP